MTQAEWEKFIRTGVVHALAISGQHLMLLAVVLWWVLRRFGVRQRRGGGRRRIRAGLRPADGRPAAGVVRGRGGVRRGGGPTLRCRPLPANLFALSWLAVGLLDPTDIFTPGCQLSFLSVAVLQWGVRPWLEREHDPLQQVIDEARPPWLCGLLGSAAWS